MKQENFGANLGEVLHVLDISQAELARKTGLTTAAIRMIISGERKPSLSSVIKILTAIPVKFERLCGPPHELGRREG